MREKSEWAQRVFFYLLSLRIGQSYLLTLGQSGKPREDHQLGVGIPKLEITWKNRDVFAWMKMAFPPVLLDISGQKNLLHQFLFQEAVWMVNIQTPV